MFWTGILIGVVAGIVITFMVMLILAWISGNDFNRDKKSDVPIIEQETVDNHAVK